MIRRGVSEDVLWRSTGKPEYNLSRQRRGGSVYAEQKPRGSSHISTHTDQEGPLPLCTYMEHFAIQLKNVEGMLCCPGRQKSTVIFGHKIYP